VIDRERVKEAVEKIKGYFHHDSLFTDYEKNALPDLITLAEAYLSGELVEVKCVKCQDVGIVHRNDPDKGYVCDCEAGKQWKLSEVPKDVGAGKCLFGIPIRIDENLPAGMWYLVNEKYFTGTQATGGV